MGESSTDETAASSILFGTQQMLNNSLFTELVLHLPHHALIYALYLNEEFSFSKSILSTKPSLVSLTKAYHLNT